MECTHIKVSYPTYKGQVDATELRVSGLHAHKTQQGYLTKPLGSLVARIMIFNSFQNKRTLSTAPFTPQDASELLCASHAAGTLI